ncbi:MAG TPA: hypothetical protein VKA55_02730 [Gammaproteobacteria bacterium]|nr:hypothetical protein [Gammaproteobacteria bacterium]
MGKSVADPDRDSTGYLVKEGRFLAVVDFRLSEEEDRHGEPRISGGQLEPRGEAPDGALEGPLVIHAASGFSIHLEITGRLPQGRFAFRIRHPHS